jgi:hypothetical protein
LKSLPVEKLFSETSDCNLGISTLEKENIAPSLDLGFKFPSSNHPRKEEFLQEKFVDKSWKISFFHLEQHIYYGPLSSYKIWIFLKNMYSNISEIEKRKKNFMIVDISSDVYFQPDAIYEILSEEYEKNAKKETLTEEIPFKIKGNASSQLPSQNLFRQLLPVSISKYNSCMLEEKKELIDFQLQIRKNSNSSSNSGSNGLSTKYSSVKSNENILVGLKPTRYRRDPKKSLDA